MDMSYYTKESPFQVRSLQVSHHLVLTGAF